MLNLAHDSSSNCARLESRAVFMGFLGFAGRLITRNLLPEETGVALETLRASDGVGWRNRQCRMLSNLHLSYSMHMDGIIVIS